MKIKPNYKNFKGIFDKDIIPFYEEFKDGRYYYELFVIINRRQCSIIITNKGVSIDYLSGASIHTNLRPEAMFPNCQKLDNKQIGRVVDVLETTDIEGKHYTAQEMIEFVERWKRKIDDQ